MTPALSQLPLRKRPPTPARYLPTPLNEIFENRLAYARAGLAAPF